ncbi:MULTISPECIES: hypothetical protein [Microbacterium]|jgi:hypothetical protein|uniref:hypothetical protein n=1 Tax=Microbacterium TaxID=33882 RepID=UPI001D178008|nr:hypothetical protein [Microbacterium testaceum]MCC4247692.1 hypothetical protein [Microbacterium testaceum]
MAPTNDPQDSPTVWYFIAATFILTLPTLLFQDLHVAVRIATLLVGVVVMGLGFVRLRGELAAGNRPSSDGPPADED